MLNAPDTESILDSVPKSILGFPEIEACRLEFAIHKDIVDQDTITQSALRTEQYWLLARYCESLNDYQAALDVINQVSWLIGKSPEIFEFAVIATSQTEGKKTAFALLKNTKNNFQITLCSGLGPIMNLKLIKTGNGRLILLRI